MITSIEKALVVDDDALMREFVVETLTRAGIQVVQANNGALARKQMETEDFDIAFVDIKMPVMGGMDVLRWKQENHIETLMVMVTAFGTVEQAVEAMKLGAIDFLMKPFSPEQVEVVLDRAQKWVGLNAQNRYLQEELGWKQQPGKTILGESASIKRLREQIEKVAASNATVLISGESGTGKELVAKAIHYLSPKRDNPFVRMNCAAVPESLADSELFGHEKGAFTGALNRRIGRFELANSGTLLLDEISEMPLNLQAKLLRVIQEREFERVGGSRTIRTDCRLIATTNRNLDAFVKEGGFRQDLYYRLNVVPIVVPSLRERPEDIPILANAFLKQSAGKSHQQRPLHFHPDTLAHMMAYTWPGNVRELEHLIERLFVMETGPELTPAMLPPEISQITDIPQRNTGNPSPLMATAAPVLSSASGSSRTLAEIEHQTILQVLEQNGGHRQQTADALGISIRTLRNKLNQYREEGILPDHLA
jgi:DNA-binding NtrC family response regulator